MKRPVRATPAPRVTLSTRTDAEGLVLEELERWRRDAIPDATTPLDAGDLVRLLRGCLATLSLDSAIASGVTVSTVHYYRRKDIIDPPVGNTAAARYHLHHLWQVAGARLAGHLGLVTLAEARDVIRGANEKTSMTFLAARVADARARAAVRAAGAPVSRADRAMRPLPGLIAEAGKRGTATSATVVALPGNAWCVVPAAHAAHASPEAAEALARALVVALRTPSSRSS